MVSTLDNCQPISRGLGTGSPIIVKQFGLTRRIECLVEREIWTSVARPHFVSLKVTVNLYLLGPHIVMERSTSRWVRENSSLSGFPLRDHGTWPLEVVPTLRVPDLLRTIRVRIALPPYFISAAATLISLQQAVRDRSANEVRQLLSQVLEFELLLLFRNQHSLRLGCLP